VVGVPGRAEVLAANYTSGTAAVLRTESGLLSGPEQLLSHPGSGPVPGRQEGSHAHQCTPTPEGTVLVSDLGADRVDEYVPTDGAGYRLTSSAQLPPGTGPRHVALRGSELWVVGELDGRLHRLRRDGGGWAWLESIALAAGPAPAGTDGSVKPSHLVISPDGSLAYTAIRGRNTVVVVGLDGDGPRLLAELDCGGDLPRAFAIDFAAGLLYVANEQSSNISIFRLGADGIPEPAGSFATGSPTCIVVA
jgi:6-phosphogluconolactonase